jgi:hypothetical protein
VLLWVLLARFAVLLIDALVARGVGGLRTEESGLRLRSLRLIAAWSVLLGLGLDLASTYAGSGAIHTWLVRLWQLLSVPVVMLLIRWWRSEIFERLDEAAEFSKRAGQLAARRRGLWSYLGVVAGAGLLLLRACLRGVVRKLSRFEWGRRVLVVLVKREVARENESAAPAGEERPSAETRARLLEAAEVRLPEPTALQRARLRRFLDAETGGALAVLGERGSGKTTLMQELCEGAGSGVRMLVCPPGGFEALAELFIDTFELAGGEDLARQLGDRLASLGIHTLVLDDAQLLARPCMGGQRALDRVIALDLELDTEIRWIFVMDRRAWPYITLARGDRVLLHDVVELSAWSEEHLVALLEARAKAAGLDPTFQHLVLPSQLDASEYESLEERNRFGYCRILWEMTGGNPEVAMGVFADSLRVNRQGEVIVRLPQAPIALALAECNAMTLLVLRVIVQCDWASVEDIAASLRISHARVDSALRYCGQNGWLEEHEGRHRIAARWYRTITLALVRQNLMPR